MSSIIAILVGALAILATIGAFIWKVFSAGKTEERAKNQEAVIKHEHETSDKIQASDNALVTTDRNKRVRDKFSRD